MQKKYDPKIRRGRYLEKCEELKKARRDFYQAHKKEEIKKNLDYYYRNRKKMQGKHREYMRQIRTGARKSTPRAKAEKSSKKAKMRVKSI